MSRASNESSGLFPGIIVGIVAFSLFGFLTFFALPLLGGLKGGLKSPTDRIAAGDFPGRVVEHRAAVSKAAKAAQLDAFDEGKVVAAMAGFKAAPAASSAVVAPNALPAAGKAEQVPSAGEIKAEKPKQKTPAYTKKEAVETPRKKREKRVKKQKAEQAK